MLEISVWSFNVRRWGIWEKGLQVLTWKSSLPLAKMNTFLHVISPCLTNYTRVSFNITSRRELEKVELIYFDVCGYINMESLGRNKNCHLDWWCHQESVGIFVKNKGSSRSLSNNFILGERETKEKLKCLKYDYGVQYTSRESKYHYSINT